MGDLSAYMTGGEAEDRSQKCRRVHLLEFAKKSHKKSKRLTELFQTFSHRGKSYDFTLDSEEHERALPSARTSPLSRTWTSRRSCLWTAGRPVIRRQTSL